MVAWRLDATPCEVLTHACDGPPRQEVFNILATLLCLLFETAHTTIAVVWRSFTPRFLWNSWFAVSVTEKTLPIVFGAWDEGGVSLA